MSGGYCYELYVIQNLMISLFVLSSWVFVVARQYRLTVFYQGFIHFAGLLIYAIVRQSRGDPIWRKSIRRLNKPEYPAFTMAPQGAWQATAPNATYGTPVMPAVWATDPSRVPTPVNKEVVGHGAVTTPST